MRLPALGATAAAAVLSAVAFAGPAHAGEITGSGKATQGPAHANSICAFSGLEDGDENDDNIPDGPSGPGVPPQNWGHVKQALRAAGVPEEAIAATRPGVSCNGHSGFLVNPPEGEAP